MTFAMELLTNKELPCMSSIRVVVAGGCYIANQMQNDQRRKSCQ